MDERRHTRRRRFIVIGTGVRETGSGSVAVMVEERACAPCRPPHHVEELVASNAAIGVRSTRNSAEFRRSARPPCSVPLTENRNRACHVSGDGLVRVYTCESALRGSMSCDELK
jgi:hypothetical protein